MPGLFLCLALSDELCSPDWLCRGRCKHIHVGSASAIHGLGRPSRANPANTALLWSECLVGAFDSSGAGFLVYSPDGLLALFTSHPANGR